MAFARRVGSLGALASPRWSCRRAVMTWLQSGPWFTKRSSASRRRERRGAYRNRTGVNGFAGCPWGCLGSVSCHLRHVLLFRLVLGCALFDARLMPARIVISASAHFPNEQSDFAA